MTGEEIQLEGTDEKQEEIQVVAFKLGKEEYAIDILNVQEIIRLLHITRVPRANQFIDGVVNLRGNIIPIINLHKKFDLEPGDGNEDDKRIIVFEVEDIRAGIIVDNVSEVLRVRVKDIENGDTCQGGLNAEMIKGIAKIDERLLILLDLRKILDLDAG